MPSSTDRSPRPVALSMSPSFATSPPTSTVQWIPNHLAAHCLSCYEDFSFLRRRHHCRRCGLIFCEHCSSKRVQLQTGAQPVRVCDKCYLAVRQATAAARQSSAGSTNSHTNSNGPSAFTNQPRLSHSATSHSLAQHHHSLRAPAPTVALPSPATHHQRSRIAAEQYWDTHVRIDDAEHIKLHLGEVILLVGRIEQLDGMSEEDIVRRVRDRRERWRDNTVREERREREDERKALHNHARTWTGPALKAIPPPSLSAGSSPQPQPRKQQPQSSRPSISSSNSSASASPSTTASPIHNPNASISKSNSHNSIASLFVSTAAGSADPASTPSSTASASPTPQPASSPSRSPMVARPYIEDELSLDDSPVIVELRRRNSSADATAALGGRDDPLARYGDRMIVKERERERVKRDDRDSRPSSRQGGKSTVVSHNPFYPGHLVVSNYQLAFIPTHVITPSSAISSSSSPLHANPSPLLPVVQLPLLAISRLSSATIEQKDLAVVELRCKDFRRLHVLFTGLTRKNRWYGYQQCCDVLKFYAQPRAEDGFASVFAFKFKGTKQPRRIGGSETAEADGSSGAVSNQRLARQGSVLLPVRHSVTPSHTHTIVKDVSALPARSKSAVVPTEIPEPSRNMYGKKDDETDDEADGSSDQFTLNLHSAADTTVDGLQHKITTVREMESSDEESEEEQEEEEETAVNTTVHNSTATVNGISIDTSLPVSNPMSPPLTTLGPSYSFRSVDEGWDVYDAYAEYARMGVPSRHWRITSINASYTFCSSYPSVLVVPKQSTDSDLLLARSFRTRHRLPVFVWRRRVEGDEGRGPVLLRSSQPMVGIMSARSTDDELLLSHAVSSTPSRSLVIVDARPLANARANVALGAGTEVAENYTAGGVDCSVVWLGVENIHTVRKSYKALWKLVVRMIEEEVAGAVVGGVVGGAMMDFWPEFIATQHFTLLSSLLAGAQFIASTLSSSSVLLHCSDGWDRTPQLSSLACLLLDPHYRTLDGFIALIELHFLSFGHKFTHRTGVGLTHVKGEESPIFHQWLDCVYQLISQQPTAFQFDERLLVFLLDSLYDGRYGTWLGNSEAERVKAGVSVRSHSVWTPVLTDKRRWKAVVYRRVEGVLSVDVRMMHFWRSYYMRYDWMRQVKRSGLKDESAARLSSGATSDVDAQVRCCVFEMVGEVCSSYESEERRRLEHKVEQLEAIVSKLAHNGDWRAVVNGKVPVQIGTLPVSDSSSAVR